MIRLCGSIDSQGLDYACDVPADRDDVLARVSSGQARGSSFAFTVQSDEWRLIDGSMPLRTLVTGSLEDVAPVDRPAYPDTDVALRSLARHMQAPIEDVMKRAETRSLSEFFTRSDNRGEPSRPAHALAQKL
jgi:uncharacterized protein